MQFCCSGCVSLLRVDERLSRSHHNVVQQFGLLRASIGVTRTVKTVVSAEFVDLRLRVGVMIDDVDALRVMMSHVVAISILI